LWLKGVPWHAKADNPQLQRQVLQAKKLTQP